MFIWQSNGGKLLASASATTTRLCVAEHYIDSSFPTYCHKYIRDCCSARMLLHLHDYR